MCAHQLPRRRFKVLGSHQLTQTEYTMLENAIFLISTSIIIDSSFKATGRALLACLRDSLQHGFLDLVFVKFHGNLVDF